MTRTVIVATTSLVLLLAAGCSGDTSSPASSSPPASSVPGASAPASSEPSASASASPSAGSAVTLTNLTGDTTRLTLDMGFLDAMRTVGVDLAPVEGAQVDTSGDATTFVFPVTGGHVTVDAAGTDRLSGSVQHQGGLRLSALGKSVTVDDLVLDGQQDQLTAMVAGQRVPLLPLSTTGAQITTQPDRVVISDDAVSLDSDAASALAGQLGLPGLPDLTLGQLQITLVGS